MTEEQKAAEAAAAVAAKKAEDDAKAAADAAAAAAAADPLNKELEKANKAKKTELEQAIYKRSQIDKRIVELGGQSKPLESSAPAGEDDDSKPLTRGDLKRMQAETAQKTAIDLASALSDENEKTLVIHYLQTKIMPSGNAEEDFHSALALVNALKNKQFLDEAARKTPPKRAASAPGGPGNGPEVPFVPTPEEAVFMRPPYNLSKEKILETRKKTEAAQR